MEELYQQHLVSELRNWWWLRAIVWWVNRRAVRAHSRWFLVVRYRRPRRGKAYGWGGSLRRREARRFSVYIRVRPGAVRWEREREQRLEAARRRFHERDRERRRADFENGGPA